MPTPNFPSSDMVTPRLEILVVHPDRVIEVKWLSASFIRNSGTPGS
ncbi:MAG TPA: hypothetical protein VMC78_16630 [Mycobacterium sp.]|nr:hypothetical protein [Mycobacterium sp.]